MDELPKCYRRARIGDAAAMTELVNFAGDGLPLCLWRAMAAPGVSPWEIGRERARRESGGFSYRNTIVREADDGRVVAALIGYPLPDEPAAVDYASLPPLVAPLQALEDLVPGTWYVNVLAAYPMARGHGYGTELLQIAEALARDAGCAGLSVIVADANTGARRLYERMGYAEVARRPMGRNGWDHPGEEWVLLARPPSA